VDEYKETLRQTTENSPKV